MAKKPSSWTREQYINAVRGIPGTDVPGLRALVEGFESTDGFNLRDFDSWTPGQKRKVRNWHEKVHFLYAQPRRILRPRRKDILRKLQENYHGDVPTKGMKVALMPFTDPARLPGAKPTKVRIRVSRTGQVKVSVQGKYNRYEEFFDKKALAKKPQQEIKRVLGTMPDARYFFVQCGQFQTLNGNPASKLERQILEWMSKYDGKKALPKSSGNYGDRPADHKWDKWLDSVIGYSFDPALQNVDMQRAVSEGIKNAKLSRHEQDLMADMSDAERQAYRELEEGYENTGMRRDKAISQASAVIKRKRKRKG